LLHVEKMLDACGGTEAAPNQEYRL
jgi:hypothetical protein